ncbi:MAG: helix-turn-helix transcriptional regulator [Clostridiales bacterium]|nr:helix-turn-helix transcriptional regulator [Clostridiales bacterium]
MDLIKIGMFIANRRKMKNLTQFELAEKLNVTDRAVSKWERGKSLPDSSIMLFLCKVLEISVNDLLSGEVVSMNNEELEKKLVEVVKAKEDADRRLLALECIVITLSIIILLISALISSYIPMADWKRIVIIIAGLIVCVVGLVFCIKIEQVAGYYECKKCGHRYIPTLKSMWASMHMGRTRYLKCPNCGKKSWQKKVISKE